jgi:hypothetical protein
MYLERQTQLGDIPRPREGSAGVFLDPAQPVADGVRVANKHRSRTAHRRENADGSFRQQENIRQHENIGPPAVRQVLTDADTPASENGEARTFKPPTGPGRCDECGWSIKEQGHAPDCTANVEELF